MHISTLPRLAELPNLINRVIESPGQPLAPTIRSFMETVLPKEISRMPLFCAEAVARFPHFILTSPQDAYELEAERIADELATLEESPISVEC